MATSSPLVILLKHDHWATRGRLDACEGLSPEPLHRKFALGVRSLHDTLVHIVGATRVWTDVLHRRDLRPRPEGGAIRPVSEIRAMVDTACKELAEVAMAHPVDELVSRTRDGKTYTFTRGVVITHVTTHSMHHRAQCLNMLRHVGVASLPKSSVTGWAAAGEA